MKQDENFKRALNRFAFVCDLKEDYQHMGSCILLFKEYCRRMALWAEVLSKKDKWPLLDVAFCVNYNWEFNYAELYDILKEKGIMVFSPRSNDIIKWYFHWEYRKLEPQIKQYNLPDPYEPAIVLFERGGDIHKEARRFEVLSARLPRLSLEEYLREEPFILLDESSLEEADRKFNERNKV